MDIYLIEDSKRSLFIESDIMNFTIQEGFREIGSWLLKNLVLLSLFYVGRNLKV
jgi:hypothetical protein